MKTHFTKEDFLHLEDFTKIRAQKRQEILKIKEARRVPLGPDATLFFENADTLWWQIQEMLYIEKGGDAQIEDELLAYNSLLPQGQELVATFMIEIDDPLRRAKVLNILGGVEHHLFLRFGGHIINAQPEEDPNRTTESGKTSAVHFVHWPFTKEQINVFSQPSQDIIIEIKHPQFSYKTLVSESVRSSLQNDFST
ncbi:MAG: DUF3501 family protein [Alphaproteobacteria bacterium]|nr:DUF3501 family protein [Alphaproteobacteria bacterium]